MREELARRTCTLQLGSVVNVRDRRSGNATFRGRVERIWPGSELSAWELEEGKDPVPELYRIYGVRLRKDGSDGRQTFEASDRDVVAEEAESRALHWPWDWTRCYEHLGEHNRHVFRKAHHTRTSTASCGTGGRL